MKHAMKHAMKLDQSFIDGVIPVRRSDTHKGDYGKVLVVGGSADYPGAPFLSAKAAYRTGSGIVYLAVPESIYLLEAMRCLEIIPRAFPDQQGKFSTDALAPLLTLADQCDAAIIGPGAGRSLDSDRLLCGLISELKCPVVLDADGINAVSENIHVLKQRTRPTVVTPHAIEFIRLGGVPGPDRIDSAEALSESLSCVVVLKGAESVIAAPDSPTALNCAGNPGMAKGGSGDVLSGIIASLIGQHLSAVDAARAGVWIHATAGDLCASEIGEYGMMPGDLIERIPAVLRKYNSK